MKIALFRRLIVWAMFALCLAPISPVSAEGMKMPVYQALTQNRDWLNTSRPLVEDDLKGRIVLVDFWTYCCINCMHVIPKLQELEHEFGDKLTVIGVHSAKFDTEGDTDNIREAIQKYGIEHPVINDADFRVWNAFGVHAWPSVFLIAPNGLMKNAYKGEGDIAEMRSDIAALIKQTGANTVTAKLPLALEKDKIPPTVLRFPTKMSLLDDNHVVISDSGHNRIVIGDLKQRRLTTVIGSGTQGFADGDFKTAQFNSPQGVLADGDMIYVADTANHRLRLIDLKTKQVSTLSGTGERGGTFTSGQKNAVTATLASPWDLAFYPDKNHIAIANAGTHQILSYDVANKTISVIAGGGSENIVDGALPGNALAQTSGLSPFGDKLYFVDAETSSLRLFDGKEVHTLIGTGLFDFGLTDGDSKTAMMQHAIGLTATSNGIYIADTYNHSIRKYKDGQLTTLPIKGLKEPNAIIPVGSEFYIADTNNHRIVSMDANGKMTGVIDFMPAESIVNFDKDLPNALPTINATSGTSAKITLELPPGWHVNPAAPSYMALFDSQKNTVSQFKTDVLKGKEINLNNLKSDQAYTIQGILYYCEDKEGSQCLIRGVQVNLTTHAKTDKISDIKINLPQ